MQNNMVITPEKVVQVGYIDPMNIASSSKNILLPEILQSQMSKEQAEGFANHFILRRPTQPDAKTTTLKSTARTNRNNHQFSTQTQSNSPYHEQKVELQNSIEQLKNQLNTSSKASMVGFPLTQATNVKYDPGFMVDPFLLDERLEQGNQRMFKYQKHMQNLKGHLNMEKSSTSLTPSRMSSLMNRSKSKRDQPCEFRKGSLPRLIKDVREKIDNDMGKMKNKFTTFKGDPQR